MRLDDKLEKDRGKRAPGERGDYKNSKVELASFVINLNIILDLLDSMVRYAAIRGG
jgi:hypothetical protein